MAVTFDRHELAQRLTERFFEQPPVVDRLIMLVRRPMTEYVFEPALRQVKVITCDGIECVPLTDACLVYGLILRIMSDPFFSHLVMTFLPGEHCRRFYVAQSQIHSIHD